MKLSNAAPGLLTAGLLIFVAGCGGGGLGGGGSTVSTTAVTSSDKNATVNVPNGGTSVAASTVTVAPASNPPASSLLVTGTAYTISSGSGTSLMTGNTSGSIAIGFSPTNLPSGTQQYNEVVIGQLTNVGGTPTWVPVPTVTTVSGTTATANVSSTGTYGVLAASTVGTYTLTSLANTLASPVVTQQCATTLTFGSSGISDSCGAGPGATVYTFGPSGVLTIAIGGVTAESGTYSISGSTLTTNMTYTGTSPVVTDTFIAAFNPLATPTSAVPALSLVRSSTTAGALNASTEFVGEGLGFQTESAGQLRQSR